MKFDIKVVEARKTYGTKSTSTWCQNRLVPRVTKCFDLNKIEKYNHNEWYQSRVTRHHFFIVLDTSLNNYHAFREAQKVGLHIG